MARIAHYTEEQYGRACGPRRGAPTDASAAVKAPGRRWRAAWPAWPARSARSWSCKLIVAFTESGSTARLVSSYRPRAAIAAITPNDDTYRRLALWWGVVPVKSEFAATTDDMIVERRRAAEAAGPGRERRQGGDAGRPEPHRRGHEHAAGAHDLVKLAASRRGRPPSPTCLAGLLATACGLRISARRRVDPPVGLRRGRRRLLVRARATTARGPSNGEVFDQDELTAAHVTFAFGTRVKVTLLSTGRSVVVRINDRFPTQGPASSTSPAARARKIGLIGPGIGRGAAGGGRIARSAVAQRAFTDELPIVKSRRTSRPVIPRTRRRRRPGRGAGPHPSARGRVPKRRPARASARSSAPGAPSPARPVTSATIAAEPMGRTRARP